MFSIPLLGSVLRLIRPFRSFTGNRRVRHPVNGPITRFSAALLRAPPRGITGHSLLPGGRLLTGGRDCALVRVPPARHCIFCLSAFLLPIARGVKGTGTGYPRCFSPMRVFRQLPLPKTDASQNGFHPAYALSCSMAWRSSLHYILFSRSGGGGGSSVSPSAGRLYHTPDHTSRKKRCELGKIPGKHLFASGRSHAEKTAGIRAKPRGGKDWICICRLKYLSG